MSQVGGMLQAITMPLVSLSNIGKDDKDKNKQTGGGALDTSLSFLTTLAFMALAGYLCWKCNEKTDMFLRIIFVILSVVFNWFYLIYYFIWHYLMAHPC